MTDDWATEKARELVDQIARDCCIRWSGEVARDARAQWIAAALRAERAQNPDTARLDKLESLGAQYAADEHHGALPSFRVRSIHSLVECSRTGVHPYATLREAIDAMREDTP